MIKARYARQLRQGIIFYELCQENHLLIAYAREVLTPLGMESFIRLMEKDGHRRVFVLPLI
ncbi:hypothetical protein ACU4IU_00065 [Brevibacterium sp. CSND-B09]|uniref:hypothetical protein n=1 Tax=Brevibacterium sp. CSND-B09 TaxID=3462571 RepID=UPI00406A0C59